MATSQILDVQGDTWPSFASYLLRHCDRFVSEQAKAWGALFELANSVLGTHEDPGSLVTARTLSEATALFERAGRQLLVATYEKCGHIRPLTRSLNAIENLDREVLSHAGAAEYVEGLRKAALRRSRVDGAMQLLLSRVCLRLGESWSAYLTREVRPDKSSGAGANEPGASRGTVSALERESAQSEQILDRYRRWVEDALIHLNLHRSQESPKEAPVRLVRKHEHHLDFWRGRQRLVNGLLEVETGLWKAGVDCLRATDVIVGDLRGESSDLRRGLQALIQYLEQWTTEPFDPPAMDARIAAPEERIEAWQSRVSTIVGEALPERIAVPHPRAELPYLLERSRQAEPRELYLRALRYLTLPVVEEQFRDRIQFHLEIAEDIVRAVEVVRYALEASPERPSVLVAEALRNSLSRLRECDQSPQWDSAELEPSLVRALLVCACEVVTLVRSGRAGMAALVARHLGRQLTELGRPSAKRQRVLLQAVDALARRSDALLVGIGWNEPAHAPVPPVSVRTQPGAPRLAVGARELSALYRQLFQITPIENPRFLVGREAEIEGFRQAHEAWRSGRFAACVMVGSRGSGKTSLLSCAIPQIVDEEPVLWRRLNERLSTRRDMERSLCSLLDIPEEIGLIEGIRANRQVIVLEEVERAFLKTIGGFEAVRALIELIHATASSALWIVVLNAHCFELLDAVSDVGSFFSHRINAMGVRSEILERAILQRHYLSGLKLSFAEVERPRLQAALGRKNDPQKAFFASLHRQSGGNFRSALELWRSSIESTEGGVIRMGQPVASDFRQVRQELGQADQFTLLSVEQHGSLTVSELARVLCEPEQASRTRLERLAGMGILEQNPEEPGIRVRPQARQIVEEVLQSVNLI